MYPPSLPLQIRRSSEVPRQGVAKEGVARRGPGAPSAAPAERGRGGARRLALGRRLFCPPVSAARAGGGASGAGAGPRLTCSPLGS